MPKRKANRETNAGGHSRVVFRIQLTVEAKKKLIGVTDETGITQIMVTSKLIEWFARQPDTIKAAILGLYPNVIKEDVATLILKNMQSGK